MKKILVISQNYTPPVFAGNQKCILEYCEMLKHLGAHVSFLYLQGFKKTNPDDLDIFKKYWGDNLFIYKRKLLLETPVRIIGKLRKPFTKFNFLDEKYPFGLTRYVKQLQKKHNFDIIIINYITLSRLFCQDLQCKKIIFTHDCFTFKNERLQTPKTLINLKPNDEAKGLRRGDTILSIQENETTLFRYLYPSGDIKTAYSIFPVHDTAVEANTKNILFLAGDSQLNINGITTFIQHVFPLILKAEPQAKLIIAGNICDKLIHLQHNNIELQGRIDDVTAFYSQGDIAINPVYQGTGLKIKTLEALSYGKATVVHPHSTEGLFNQYNIPVLIGHTHDEFAAQIIKLMQDKKLRKEISSKSINYIKDMNTYIQDQYNKIVTL